MSTIAERLAERALSLSYEDIPEEVLEQAKLHLLDALGVALAAASVESGEEIVRAARSLGAGEEGTVIGAYERLPVPSAALVNGTLIHGLEYDDTHTGSIIHASSVVVPSVLAAAEEYAVDGKELLTALVLGWETIIRLGLVAPGAFQARGFHTTGVCGGFASALVAGRLAGLSAQRLASALGIAGSMASGLFEYVVGGASVKSVHPGWAAHSGIVATRLARSGISGPKTVFEGRFGFYSNYTDRAPEELPLHDLYRDVGERWYTTELSYKPYPCCHFNHAFLDCAAQLVSEGLKAEDVEEVVCRVAPEIVPVVCEPREAKASPQSGYEARFSLPYSVAAMLRHGEVGLDTFSRDNVADRSLLGLAQRVRYEPDPDTRYPETFPGSLEVTTRGGDVLSRDVEVNRGGPRNPMPEEEILRKFRDNARRTLGTRDVERVLRTVQSLEEADGPRSLCELLRAAEERSPAFEMRSNR
ncbi:MmgE/PrpD family protein [Rubrobacter marinus]|uniref:MmgE/PrpD family protein n=1 Tax=Rubrobacter marinus TaxID=2653852 RepID=A0A6G8PWB6_9ACTN|nr:MmgE/PrpD family protein [Rubrobacter marinus]QIN78511.1 MmgE/PrpD family protein [Rubrobacter marinus]